MGRLRFLWHQHSFDVLIAAAAIAGALEVALRDDSTAAPRTTPWFTMPAIAFLVLLLLGRRRFPFGAPALLWLLAAAISFVDGRLIPFPASAFAAGLAASLLLGNLRDPVQARLGLAIVLTGAAIVVYNDPNNTPSEFFFTPGLFAIAWLAGFAMRGRVAQAEAAEERATQAEREREAAARVAVAEERTRIARELHDIVAHAVSVMVLQVGAVRHNLPEAFREEKGALSGVEKTGREALAQMRHLLGALHGDRADMELAPQPGLGSLNSLVDQVSGAGLPVRLHFDGERFPVPRGIDLSAYRIIQEGLTNALKHSSANHVDVRVGYRSDELEIEVRDDGDGASASDGFGHGLVGLRERVKIYGGEMTAGSEAGGGFVLSTRLPLPGDAA